MTMKNKSIFWFAGLCALLALSATYHLAWAQGVPADPDPADLVSRIFAAFTAKNWLLLGMLVTAAVVWVAEHYLVKVVPILAEPRPSALLALVMALAVAAINGIVTAGGVTVLMVVGYLVAGFTAWGGLQRLIGLFTAAPAKA